MIKRIKIFTALFILTGLLFLHSCTDKFDYMENNSPEWLGENIYDYLKQRGDCNYYVRLIDDCGYTETMRRTGSNTLFFSNDEAFERFFQNNTQGIRSYEDIPLSMKNMLLRLGMLNNAYLIDRLGVSDRGSTVFRRTTYFNPMDSIPMVRFEDMPKNHYFDKFNGRTVKLLQDNSSWTLIQFFQSVMNGKRISPQDYNFITGRDFREGDAYIYSSKIIKQNITCKNGYLHELDELLLPPENMAGYIRHNEQLSSFNKLMDRFAIPLVVSVDPITRDTIFNLRYFNNSPAGNAYTVDPTGKTADGVLYFDPGWNRYQATANISGQDAVEDDMGAMFVPTNEAMNDYFRVGGEGEDLFTAFGSWENVPNSIIADFISNHQKYSFLASLPSRFNTMKDEAGYEMNVKESDIAGSYVARNGLVYTLKKVLPPLDYRSVMGPIKIDVNTQIFNKSMGETYVQFQYYLRSLRNTYQFFVTPDAMMTDYLDPVSLGYTSARIAKWKFRVATNGNIQATVYSTQTGDSIGVVTDINIIKNRLSDILDQHTIVGNINPGQEYYITKGGAPIHLTGNTVNSLAQGAGNKERSNTARITHTYDKVNGRTYYIDRILENSTTSVFRTLTNHTEFSEFLRLCNYAGLFVNKPTLTTSALDLKVGFFDLYRYTIYVPTNAALTAAINSGAIPDPDDIEAETDLDVKNAKLAKLVRILRYHFQDNSVFIKGEEYSNRNFLSSTINYSTNKFYPITVTNQGGEIQLKTATNEIANVIKGANLYNLLARDIVVNNADPTRATLIETSSWAVVHQVDKVLWFE